MGKAIKDPYDDPERRIPELEELMVEMTEEAISVKLDYEENPSNLDSGSIVGVHQNSSLLNNLDEELSDIAYNVQPKSSSINTWGDDDWATPHEGEKNE